MKVFIKIIVILFVLTNCLSSIESIVPKDNDMNCDADVVESIPIGLTFNTSITSKSTFDELIWLISKAERTIDIASYYWTLQGTDVMPKPDESSLKGTQLLNALIDSSKSRSISIRIVANDDANSENSTDLQLLEGLAQIRRLNFTRLMGSGVLHTKFWVIDNTHLYIGSANMDWRSLTQVKEMGLLLKKCHPLASDLSKIFEVYWYLGTANSTIPKKWPEQLSTNYNLTNPLSISLNDRKSEVFLSLSPKPFCPSGRTNDITAILSVINSAKKFIYIAVMDYSPRFLYTKDKQFWPRIDDALKRAVIDRKVSVKLMASQWNHTSRSMPIFLKSLAVYNNSRLFGATLQVKLFSVPAFTPSQAKIPFSRVNHNKYMVTDRTAYIGTSNWSADYFVYTAGVGISVTPKTNETNLRDQLQSIFERDWYSSYAQPLTTFDSYK